MYQVDNFTSSIKNLPASFGLIEKATSYCLPTSDRVRQPLARRRLFRQPANEQPRSGTPLRHLHEELDAAEQDAPLHPLPPRHRRLQMQRSRHEICVSIFRLIGMSLLQPKALHPQL